MFPATLTAIHWTWKCWHCQREYGSAASVAPKKCPDCGGSILGLATAVAAPPPPFEKAHFFLGELFHLCGICKKAVTLVNGQCDTCRSSIRS